MSQPQRIDPLEDSAVPPRDPAGAATVAALDLVFGADAERITDIRLWDGTVRRGTREPRADFSLNVRRRGALRRMLLPPSELPIVEAFISNAIDIEGNIESAMGLGDAVGTRIQSLAGIMKVIPNVLALPRDDESPALDESRYARSLRLLTPRARKSTEPEIQFHYDVGNDFYALWLDASMQYPCSHHLKTARDLRAAQ